MKPRSGRRLVNTIFGAMFLAFIIPAAASANSSWHWLGDDPTSLLPIAIVMTLSIELSIVMLFGGVPRRCLTLAIGASSIIVANLVSYILPYISLAGGAVATYGIERSEALFWAVSKGPYFIIGPMSLILTLICEYPIVYFSMRRAVNNRVALSRSIIVANIITTAMVALMERTLIKGSW